MKTSQGAIQINSVMLRLKWAGLRYDTVNSFSFFKKEEHSIHFCLFFLPSGDNWEHISMPLLYACERNSDNCKFG